MSELPWAGQRVVVTGGAGFIGSHLAEALFTAGAEVIVLDIAKDPHLPGIKYRYQDLMLGPWPDVSSVDVIFHFAANAYVPPSVENPMMDFQTNCGATIFMIDELRKQQWQGRLIFASSAAVYGNPTWAPVREDHPTVPVSPYGVGKLAAERYCAVFAKLYGMHIAELRLFSVYGPRQRKQVVWDLMNKIHDCTTGGIPIHGDGSQTRDFVYVEDVVRAAMMIADNGDLAGEVYNIGSGVETSIHTLVTELCAMMGADLRLEWTGVNRPGDPEKFVADITKMQTIVPWGTNLYGGLSDTVKWFTEIKETEADGVG